MENSGGSGDYSVCVPVGGVAVSVLVIALVVDVGLVAVSSSDRRAAGNYRAKPLLAAAGFLLGFLVGEDCVSSGE